MLRYLLAIWRCRYFWMALVEIDLRTRYRRSVLGVGWSLLHPIAMTVILCAVFHQVFKVDIASFAPYLLAGLAFWNYFSSAIVQGCQSLHMGEAYIRQYPAPMAIYPLRTTLGALIHFLLALGIVLVLAWSVHGFGNLASLWTLVPTIVLLFIFGWSVGLLAGFANVYFPDVKHILEIALQFFFYATPIIYEAKLLPEWALQANPLVAFLHLVRDPILEGQMPGIEFFLQACMTVLLTAGLALVVIKRLQRRIVFQL